MTRWLQVDVKIQRNNMVLEGGGPSTVAGGFHLSVCFFPNQLQKDSPGSYFFFQTKPRTVTASKFQKQPRHHIKTAGAKAPLTHISFEVYAVSTTQDQFFGVTQKNSLFSSMYSWLLSFSDVFPKWVFPNPRGKVPKFDLCTFEAYFSNPVKLQTR